MYSPPISVGLLGPNPEALSIAYSLLNNPRYEVQFYNAGSSHAIEISALGGTVAQSPREAAEGVEYLICMADMPRLHSYLFGKDTSILQALPKRCTILFCSAIEPDFYKSLEAQIARAGRSDILILDCPVTGSTKSDKRGAFTMFAAGKQDAIEKSSVLLNDISETWFMIPGGIGAASKIRLIHQLLVGIHVSATSEAVALATKAGLNVLDVYNVITNAAGSSKVFEDRMPRMVEGDWAPGFAMLDALTDDMASILSISRSLQYPLPLSGIVEQLCIAGTAKGYGKEHDAGLVRLLSSDVPNSAKSHKDAAQATIQPNGACASQSDFPISKIGMIGLGAMGRGMAASLLRAGYTVQGYDVMPKAVETFLRYEGNSVGTTSPTEALKDAEVVVIMVQSAAQVDDVLFGKEEAIHGVRDGAVIIISSTVSPSYIRKLLDRIESLGRGLSVLDAPVSGGAARAANGTLTIMYSGDESAIRKVRPTLLSMAGDALNLKELQGGIGAASSVKLVNQLLAGIHIAAAAEALSFAARLGLDPNLVFDVLINTSAWSWMLENRGPQMLDADWTPYSSLAIFVKDMGIVVDEAKRLGLFAPLSSTTNTLYLCGAAHGWAQESDAGIVRFWELVTGNSVADSVLMASKSCISAASPQVIPAKQVMEKLPPEFPANLKGTISQSVTIGSLPILVVLDDDPTGTQTCHDINVLMAWDEETLISELALNPTGFFILTNSRALPSVEAKGLIIEICTNVQKAANKAQKKVEIVLRGDSTLRGHLPEEPGAVESVFGSFDGWIMAPFFYQGGRYTINDVHYVKENGMLIPVGQTPFAQDATFGYKSSNLRNYVMEKCPGRFSEESFVSVSLDDLRIYGPSRVTEKLLAIPAGRKAVIIVNAVAESDMDVFVKGLLEATKKGRRYLHRTGAAFVSSRLGITGIAPLSLDDANQSSDGKSRTGGLIVAGSYVPKTTAQLDHLRKNTSSRIVFVELEVSKLIESSETATAAVDVAVQTASEAIASGQNVLVMTSRGLVTGENALDSLKIGSLVASGLSSFVEKINIRPRYLIAKGGITSSDAASKGLKMKRARVMGQAAPGVPLWVCRETTCRFPGLPYVVFPGNVGSESTLTEIVERWER